MTAAVWDYVMYQGSKIAYGLNSDAVYGLPSGSYDGSLELTTSWAVNAAYTHFWNPAWKTTLWGSYMAQSYNDTANAGLCGGTAQVTAGCDNNWDIYGVGLRTEWAVSSTFSIGLEALYSHIDTATPVGGSITQANANNGKPGCTVGGLGSACYTADNLDNWALRLRINRNFYP
jgi:Porin subfamily